MRNAYATSLVLAASFAIMSCQEVTPLILVNESTDDAVVSYSMRRKEISPGKLAGCQIGRHVPRVRNGVVASRKGYTEGWVIVDDSEVDLDACTVKLELKAGTSLWAHTNGMCDDYEKRLRRNPDVQPPMQNLTITSREQTVTLTGWQVARAFKLQHGICVLRFTDDGRKF